MAITYPRSLPPTPGFRDFKLIARNVVSLSASPYTGQQQTYEFPGKWWEAQIGYPPMARDSAERVLAALLSLYGRKGTFLLGDPLTKSARGSLSGSPQHAGTAAGLSTLALSGFTASAKQVLLAGDYIQTGSGATQRLYKVLLDADADGGGLASAEIFPNVREAVSGGAALVTSNCKGLFRLAENSSEWSVDYSRMYGIEFSAVEAL